MANNFWVKLKNFLGQGSSSYDCQIKEAVFQRVFGGFAHAVKQRRPADEVASLVLDGVSTVRTLQLEHIPEFGRFVSTPRDVFLAIVNQLPNIDKMYLYEIGKLLDGRLEKDES